MYMKCMYMYMDMYNLGNEGRGVICCFVVINSGRVVVLLLFIVVKFTAEPPKLWFCPFLFHTPPLIQGASPYL